MAQELPPGKGWWGSRLRGSRPAAQSANAAPGGTTYRPSMTRPSRSKRHDPPDDVQDRMHRLAQRQDQLERQQRETTTRVDALNRDVDSRMDSLRIEIDWQFRDREWRINSLEQSRDTVESLISLWMPLVAAIAMIIVLVMAAIGSREQRQEAGEPEQRSPSSMNALPASSGGRVQPGFAVAGTPLRQHHRHSGNHGRRAPSTRTCGLRSAAPRRTRASC